MPEDNKDIISNTPIPDNTPISEDNSAHTALPDEGKAIHDKEENNEQVPIDPVTELLSRLNFPDILVNEIDACNWNQEKYEHYFTNVDLFIIRDILGNAMMNDDDQTSIYHLAFCNLMKWFMYMIATNNHWHRRLCYYNRMMGTNINAQSYWRVKFHPAYVPGPMWNDDPNKTPSQFNSERMDLDQFYKWVDNIEEKMFEDQLKSELAEDQEEYKKQKEQIERKSISIDNTNKHNMACKGKGKKPTPKSNVL